MRSKALFRFGGTLVGSMAALLLVPALVNAPELLSLALACWVALCLYVSLLDRTPRAYLFMLAGYTAALIGFPAVTTPELMFDTAIARVEEIGLGILCASVVHSIVLPASLAPSVLGLMDRTLADARRWLGDLLDPLRTAPILPGSADSKLTADRRRLAADITQLRLLSTHVPFDTTHLRWTAGAIRAMQDRVAALTPMLSAVEDRLRALQDASGQLPADVAALLTQAARWLEQQQTAGAASDDPRAGRQAMTPAIEDFCAAAQARAEPGRPGSEWQLALRIGLAQRLAELVDNWWSCGQLRRDIDSGLSGAAVPLRRTAELGNRVLHRDRGMALLSALAVVIAVGLCCLFWIVTAWPMGYVAAMMAAIFSCFFAAMDDPVPAMHGFLKWTLWSIPLSALYVLILLPLVQDFGMLVLVCAPLFLVLGLYIARPATFGIAMPLFFGVAGTLSMHDTANADLTSFLNFMVAEAIGVVVAARVARLMRSVGAAWSARRIQRATWRELGHMAEAGRPHDPSYAVRMLDRIGLLAPRIAQAGGTVEGVVAHDALRDLRVGTDIAALQRARGVLPAEPLDALMRQLHRFFIDRAEGGAPGVPPAALPCLDRLLAELLRARPVPAGERRRALAALVGLRRNLFPDAPADWAPAPSLQGVAP